MLGFRRKRTNLHEKYDHPVLPGFWLASLTWVGIRAGHAIQGLSDGSKSAGQAGGKGPGALTGGKLK